MSRYIDADKAPSIMVEMPMCKQVIDAVMKMVIDRLPTEDVVEVVRCKDCFYAEETEGIIGGTCLYCTQWCKNVDGDTFCSYGERRK